MTTTPDDHAQALHPGPAMVDVADVVVGERDRVDLGDVEALAASIEGVGLLHPVVISPSRQLIAGGRRLAAVRSLGWVRMPVTVAQLSTVAELLRAEADENTQRKALTGTEALAAAERREKILAEMARERQRQAPGEARGVKVSGGNLPQQSATETGKTRDLAAVGTGFSATSLRKVAVVRDAAEAETVRHGGESVPVPEPVREVAREALAAVSRPGAKVDRAYRQVQDALEEAAPPPDAEAPGPAPPARRRARRPLVETSREVAHDLHKIVKRVQRLAGDDRLGRNRADVASSLHHDLTEAVEVCGDLAIGLIVANFESGAARWRVSFLTAIKATSLLMAQLAEADEAGMAGEEEWAIYLDLHAAMGRHIAGRRTLGPRLAAVTHLGAGGSGEPSEVGAG